jgi:energy-coupling factor transporter ATP-binding protein EcfA2
VSPKIPAALLTPPTSQIPPPPSTKKQELPFGELSWRDFERLCLRLADRESEVEDCRQYGVQGDDQEGIDLLARERETGRYRVYQCKKEKNFGAAKIRKAVAEFLKGSWRTRTNKFYLCTKENLTQIQRAEEVEAQRSNLDGHGIELVTWDAGRLNTVLKDHSDVVDDFFGRPWAKEFCGEDAARLLGDRLDVSELRELRGRLGIFYHHAFRQQDPEFPFRDPENDASEPLVLPDVVPQVRADEGYRVGRSRTHQAASPLWQPTEEDSYEGGWQSDSVLSPGQRIPVDTWLAEGGRCLLVGGPGTGKSTLLRSLTLDLLSSSPQSQAIAQQWGSFFPIWLPFARWAALLAQSTVAKVGLKEFVADWLRLQGEEELTRLVEHALKDKRLLLVVDGLDESPSETTAHNALNLLDTFAASRGVPVIATTRPRDAVVSREHASGWRVAELAPLSPNQQQQIVAGVFHRHPAPRSGTEPEGTVTRIRAFLDRTARRPELAEIARTPLLLGLLAQLWDSDAELPENRFNAYREFVTLLLMRHPSRRNAAAFLAAPEILPTDVLRQAFATLALWMQQNCAAGSASRRDVLEVLQMFLENPTEGPALPVVDAKKKARELVSFASEGAALLVTTSPTDLSFYHPVLREYLAAEAIAGMPTDERLRIVLEHVRDPHWAEVVLSLIAHTSAANEVRILVDEITSSASTRVDELLSLPLLANIAFGIRSCPSNTALKIAARVCDEIELGNFLPVKRDILRTALRGRAAGDARALMDERLSRWLPRRYQYREGIYIAMRDWPLSEETERCLFRGLRDERVSESRAAAASLVRMGLGEPRLLERLLETAGSSPSPRIRAALLCGLLDAGVAVSDHDCERVVGASPYAELAFAALRAKVARGCHGNDDLAALCELDRWDGGLQYEWRGEIADLLVQGWCSSDSLRQRCVEALDGAEHRRLGAHLDVDTARRVLIRCFSSDSRVAERLAEEFSSEHGPLDSSAWPLYAEFAQDSAPITAAMDAWLEREGDEVVNAHWAACTTRSARAKASMLSALRGSAPWWAARALLEGWGMDDADISKEILAIANGESRHAAEIAHLLPRIFPDQADCRRRLMELLPLGYRCDFIVRGLAETRPTTPDPEVVTALLAASHRESNDIGPFRIAPQIIRSWPDDPRIEGLAYQELEFPEGDTSAVAVAAKTNSALRAPLTKRLGVLPPVLRATIAEALAERSSATPTTPKVLRDYVYEMHPSVRSQCAIAHCRFAVDDEATLSRFTDEVVQVGFNHGAVREAAFCGLLSLGRLDLFVDARERHTGNDEEASVHAGWGREANTVLWRLLSEHWATLRSELGPDLERRLSGDRSSGGQWEKLAAFAQPDSELSADILSFAKSLPPHRFGVNLLRFLQRAQPKSERLREVCLELLHPDEGSPAPWSAHVQVTAGQVLASSFGGDPKVLEMIVGNRRPDAIGTLDIYTMCVGWSDSDELRQIFEYLLVNRPQPPNYLYYGSVVATMSGPTKVADLIEMHADPTEGARAWEVAATTPLIIRRVRASDDLADLILKRLETMGDAVAASALRMFLAARGPTPKVEHELRRRAEPALSGAMAPSIGVDPYSGERRPAWETMMDGLFSRR